ncbi:unnamed protein product [Clonostachys rosea]|uniref:Uncharacterized protein n=1 Tax=Bionectria ochroleuca TaxID=29856 RepID=A0ABY6UD85_BIOOC|nr:unnamed protein product [Clonostachys rosea]
MDGTRQATYDSSGLNGRIEVLVPEEGVQRVGSAGPICGVGMRPAVFVALVSKYLVHFYHEAP